MFSSKKESQETLAKLQSANSSEQQQQREVFTNYVKDIAEAQRNVLANRVIKIAAHQRAGWSYFWGCQGIACGGCLVMLWFFGPRNAYSNSSYVLRAIGPSMGVGLALYGILWQSRLTFMKFRVWAMIEDYEYELRRVKAHHVAEGATHLAWLEFVLEQIKADRSTQLDPEALKRTPQCLSFG